jgi:Sec-independent protein secretion pathway component TatC
VNQALVAGPLLVLYEVGILLARIAGRSRKKTNAITSA